MNVYKNSPAKTITLFLVSVKVVSSLFLGSNNNNKRLNTVISSSVVKKVHCNKFSVFIKIIYFLSPDISFYNKRLDAEVHNNILFKFEEK